MIAIRTLGWSMLVLAAFAGCGKEPETPTTAPADSTPAPATAAPETPPSTAPGETKSEPDKGTTSPGTATDLPKIDAPQPTPATKPDDKGAAAAVTLSGEEVAEIKKLPAGEAESALKQLVCPVSGENLGAMGMPVKVTAAGQTFYLCCKGCSKDVADDPAAVVAKLRK